MLRQKPTQVLPWKLLKKATIHLFCLFDESRFSGISVRIDCVNIWKTSEAANLVFQWIFLLKSVKHKLSHVSIVNSFHTQLTLYFNYFQ